MQDKLSAILSDRMGDKRFVNVNLAYLAEQFPDKTLQELFHILFTREKEELTLDFQYEYYRKIKRKTI